MKCQFLVEVGPDLLDYVGFVVFISTVGFFLSICMKSTVSLLGYLIIMEDQSGFISVFPTPSLRQQRWHSESLLNYLLTFVS